jgi:serine phosphatase RsbU (regulator of sigma subunit)
VDARSLLDFILAVAAVGASVIAYRQSRYACPEFPAAVVPEGFVADPLPGVSIGSAVLTGAPNLDAGGDIVDVFALDARFALLLVADVSGKGAQAATQTAFIRYTIRTLALEGDGDPAVILAKFNAMYFRTVKDDEAFVVLILGIIDSQTGELRYASAGHEPAFVRRFGGELELLPPTGPIIGAAPFSAYSSEVVRLDPGDVVVWTTDGLTESRDGQRRLLGTEGLAAWIAAAPPEAGDVADSLVAALRRRSGGAATQDDVAVLAVTYDGASSRRLSPVG